MKRLLLIILLIFNSTLFYAQKNPVKELNGEQIKVKPINRTIDFSDALKIGDEYFLIGKKKMLDFSFLFIPYVKALHHTDFVLYKLDNKMNVKEWAVIPALFNNKDIESLSIKNFDNQLVAFFYFNNVKHRKQYLFAQKINMQTLKLEGNPYKIGEVAITKKQKNINCQFDITITEDGLKMLVIGKKVDPKITVSRNTRVEESRLFLHIENITYWVYNNSFEIINEGKDINFSKKTLIIDKAIDNEGNLCLLGFGKSIDYTGGYFSGTIEYMGSDMMIKIISNKGKQTDLKMAAESKFFSAKMIFRPSTGNLVVVGLLDGGSLGTNGIFSQEVNLKEAKLREENYTTFDEELINSIGSLRPLKSSSKKTGDNLDSKSSNGDYIPKLTRIGYCYFNDSNQLIVVAQKHYSFTERLTTYGYKGSVTTFDVIYYVFGDILVFKLGNEGNVDEFGHVFHYNKLSDKEIYKDYSALYKNDKIYFISYEDGAQINFDNTTSKIFALKEHETVNPLKPYTFSGYFDFNKSEILYIVSKRRKLQLTRIYINLN